MTHRHRCADMCYNGIKFIEVQFVLVFLLIAFVTETFQNEWRWAVTADLLHSPGESFDVQHQKSGKDLERNRSDGLGVAAAFITTKMIFHPKVFTSDARVLQREREKFNAQIN